MKFVKRAMVIVAIPLLLAGCARPVAAPPAVGEVVSCTSVLHTDIKVGLKLPCLDQNSSLYFKALRGPLIVNVWGSWCAPCKEEIPYIRNFYQTSKTQVQILGVDVEEATSADGKKFILANGMSWPSVIDPDGRSRGFFGMGVPVTWFIDSTGAVVHKKIGVLKSEAELRDLARKYLHLTVS